MTHAASHTQPHPMDRMYRYTRHIYDATRKPYLLGRDRLLASLDVRPGDHILEVGSGTARNLIKLAGHYPDHRLYGLDASAVMLKTAQTKVARHGLSRRVTLRHALAESWKHLTLFGLHAPLDVIFFSYSLSMIPLWRQALDCAASNLAPGRSIYIVDFWDQADLPPLFARSLRKWLTLFGVHHRPELLAHLQSLPGHLTVTSHRKRYAYLARYTPANRS